MAAAALVAIGTCLAWLWLATRPSPTTGTAIGPGAGPVTPGGEAPSAADLERPRGVSSAVLREQPAAQSPTKTTVAATQPRPQPQPPAGPPLAADQGTDVRRRITQRWSLTIGTAVVPGGSDAQMPATSGSLRIEHDLLVLDRRSRGAVGSYPPLARTFERVSWSATADIATTGAAQRQTAHASSPLTGRTVVFAYRPAERRYRARFLPEQRVEDARGKPSDDWLDGLNEDLDLRAFQPPAGARSRWKVGGDQLRALLQPGGLLPLEWGRSDPNDSFDARLGLPFPLDEISGEVAFVAKSQKVQEDGRSLRPISVRYEVQVAGRRRMESTEVGAPAEYGVKGSLRGTGALSWDPEASSFERASGEAQVDLTLRYQLQFDASKPAIAIELPLEGSLRWSIVNEDADQR